MLIIKAKSIIIKAEYSDHLQRNTEGPVDLFSNDFKILDSLGRLTYAPGYKELTFPIRPGPTHGSALILWPECALNVPHFVWTLPFRPRPWTHEQSQNLFDFYFSEI